MPNNLQPNPPQPVAQPQALQKTVAAYNAELVARVEQLQDDLAIYQGKLRDLKRLDPLDFTGLQHLYTAHVQQIERLLKEFDDVGA